jgi:hypothetical protein
LTPLRPPFALALVSLKGCPILARTEARIFTSIWADPDFLSLTRDAQGLYMFLLSQRELSYCGVMPLRPSRWAPKAAGLSLADVERDLKELEGTAYPSPYPSPKEGAQGASRRPFVIADADTGEIFIRSLLRRDNAWKQPNLLKQAIDSSEEIESPRIRTALLAEVRRLPVDESPSEQVKTLIAEWAQMLDQGTAYPSPYPSPNPGGNPQDNPSGDSTDDSAANPSDDSSADGRPGAGSPNPPIPYPLSPTSLSAPAARDRKLGTRLPDDFEAQIRARPDLADWFRENCPHVDGKRETERFRDHWVGKPGKDGRKLDWIATWRNWMRTAEDRMGPRQRQSGAPPQSSADRAQVQVAELKAEVRKGAL